MGKLPGLAPDRAWHTSGGSRSLVRQDAGRRLRLCPKSRGPCRPIRLSARPPGARQTRRSTTCRTWLAAIKSEAGEAKRDQAALPAFRALRLNAGMSDVGVNFLIASETWLAIEGEAERAGPCVWGIDLGTSAAMSAVAGYWPETGRLETMAAFPAEPSACRAWIAGWRRRALCPMPRSRRPDNCWQRQPCISKPLSVRHSQGLALPPRSLPTAGARPSCATPCKRPVRRSVN